jgi:small-conductance mechanosensitive channel
MELSKLMYPAAIAVCVTLLLYLIRGVVLRIAGKWARKTSIGFDDAVIESLRTPSLYWCLAIGIYAGIVFSQLPDRHVELLTTAIYVILVISITIAAGNLAGSLFDNYVRKSTIPVPSTGLAYGIIKGTIFVVGFLIILNILGISITPLLTALGVGGLAVALALQDTLSNLFAGVHILLEKSIRVGDFIKLENGQEGYVEDITWRTTRVRMLPNNMVVIPNSKLSQSVVTNYYLPEKRMSLLVPVGVSYSEDPDEIERILVEEAEQATGEVPGLLADPAPFVRFIPGFGDSSLNFTLICQVQEFTDQYLAQHELRKRIFRRFRKEGIDIPFPQRTVHLRQENA